MSINMFNRLKARAPPTLPRSPPWGPTGGARGRCRASSKTFKNLWKINKILLPANGRRRLTATGVPCLDDLQARRSRCCHSMLTAAVLRMPWCVWHDPHRNHKGPLPFCENDGKPLRKQ